MPEYQLSPDADQDLLEILVDTIETWGLQQSDRYESQLLRSFEAIGRGAARMKTPIPYRPELRSLHCQHHYVFSLHDADAVPIIIAIFHKNMDMLTRLQNRLSENA